ncbi:glycosyltransferase involved in cell wall biosynthesis [Pedobacter sp. UYP30]|uniref:glycosyltransferase family 4 protein n=1 Tax=Pedobacter sp. UYP30 TaxID=1756400 RepID=UPI00339590D7
MANKIIRTYDNFLDLLRYPQISAGILKKTNLFFFFQRWSIGGAERVQLDILELFKNENPTCFITSKSPNTGFKKPYKALANVINLNRWAEKNSYKAYMLKKVAVAINAASQPVVFGSNSNFMYELIPLLNERVKIVDLIHNFRDDKQSTEWYSLPYVHRIEARIVVSKTIVQQFKALYTQNNISLNYLERLKVVHNKIPCNSSFPTKNYKDNLQVIFVSRNSEEKRVHVIIRIAELCHKLQLPLNFNLIGDFSALQTNSTPNTQFAGEIKDVSLLNEYYKKSNLLLLTSKTESWGLVIFEGMSFGVVPISTKVGELSDYISDKNENGAIVNNIDDLEELAILFVNELKKFCADRNKLKKFSENAFNTIANLAKTSDFDERYKNVIFGRLD